MWNVIIIRNATYAKYLLLLCKIGININTFFIFIYFELHTLSSNMSKAN